MTACEAMHGGQRGQRHHRIEQRLRHQQVEGVFDRFDRQESMPLTQVVEVESREHKAELKAILIG